ncbi:MAG: hypothetical protein Q9168_008250, partial [Polycauliona sp. 1 TL-2023]
MIALTNAQSYDDDPYTPPDNPTYNDFDNLHCGTNNNDDPLRQSTVRPNNSNPPVAINDCDSVINTICTAFTGYKQNGPAYTAIKEDVYVSAVSHIAGSCEGHALFPDNVRLQHQDLIPTYADCVGLFQEITIKCMYHETTKDKQYGVIRVAKPIGGEAASVSWEPFNNQNKEYPSYTTNQVSYMMGPIGTFGNNTQWMGT